MTAELFAKRADEMYRRRTIFRRRWGGGPGAFGILGEIRFHTRESGALAVNGTLYEIRDRPVERGMLVPGRRLDDVDLLRLHESAWTPVFVSRIRRPRRRTR